jgi:sugar (pentulose or hexulose) kinase
VAAEGEEIVGWASGQQHGSVFLAVGAEDRIIQSALLWNDQSTEAQTRKIS